MTPEAGLAHDQGAGDSRLRVALLLAGLVWSGAALGCSTFSISANRCPALPSDPRAAAAHAEVKVQYLGDGGYSIRRGDDVVLFGPVYTNPSLPEVAFDHEIGTDRYLVDRLLPLEDAALAKAIVIGHSHYDHLLDTPYIAQAHARSATVFGSSTVVSLLSGALPGRLQDVESAAKQGTYIPIGTTMRLWPFYSRHSDQVRLRSSPFGFDVPLHGWRGEVLEPQAALPKNVSGWREGKVYTYVLDLLNARGLVDFRIYYQDSGTDAPTGFPWGGGPPPDGKRIDLALICVGGDFEGLLAHPEGIIAVTKPRFLILGHWEDFFVPQTEICRTGTVRAIPPPEGRYRVPATKRFLSRARRAMSDAELPGEPLLPCPTASVFYLPIDSANDTQVYRRLRQTHVRYDCDRTRSLRIGGRS